MKLKNKQTKMASTKPRKNRLLARRPIAKDETTMLAESHCVALKFCRADSPPIEASYHSPNVQ